jgi:hypothetical protein
MLGGKCIVDYVELVEKESQLGLANYLIITAMKNFDTTVIVLTGTIIPNTTNQLQHRDPLVRKSEYLTAIKFYSQFAPVYFLENSTYSLLEDTDFQHLSNTCIKKIPVSTSPEKGRGFQEFEMIDYWLNTEFAVPAKFLKITGRYIYENIQDILTECHNNSTASLLINQYRLSGFTESAIFYVTTAYYQQQIAGLYQECDDRSGWFIEKALHQRLQSVNANVCQRFEQSLSCTGIEGFSGQKMRRDWRDRINRNVATISYMLDKKYLWLKI